MRIQKFVSSAIVIGALMGSTALVGDALAQKGTSMMPSTSWAINAVNSGPGSYCALARQYNQNTVLTVARNQSAETSFALDFQTPIFAGGATSTVVLDPGAGQQRAFKVRPVSDTAFVIKLGQDARFFDAMSRTGMLRVEIGARSYHFNVADIDVGQSRLDACLVNMVMPAAGEETLSPMLNAVQAGYNQEDIDRAVADASRAHRQEINALRNKINTLRDENAVLAQQKQAPAAAPVADDAITAKLEQQVKNLEDQNVSLQRQLADAAKPDLEVVRPVRDIDPDALASLKAENAKLKADLQAMKPDNGAEIAALEAEVKSLLQQNEDLRKAAEVKSQDEADLETLRTQISSLEQQNRDLSAQILQERAKVSEEYAQRVEALEIANAALSEKTDGGGQDEQSAALLAQNAEHIASLEQKIDALKAENDAKDKELVVVGQSMAELQSLQEANNKLKADLEAQQAQGAMTKDLLARITELENTNEALMAQAEAAKASQGDAGVQLAALEKENEALKAQMNAQDAGKAQEIVALEAENTRLKEEINVQKSMQEQEVAALKTQLDALKAERSSLDSELADAGAAHGALDKMKAENTRLQGELANANTELQELQTVREELANLKAMTEQDSNAAQLSLTRLRAEHESLQVAHDDLLTQRDELKKTLRDVVDLAEAYKKTNTEQQARIAGLEDDASALAEQLKDKDREIELALQQQNSVPETPKAEPVEKVKNKPVENVVKDESYEIAQAQMDAPDSDPVVLDKDATFKEVMKAIPEPQPQEPVVQEKVQAKPKQVATAAPEPLKKLSAPVPLRKPAALADTSDVVDISAMEAEVGRPENQTPVRQYIAQQKAAKVVAEPVVSVQEAQEVEEDVIAKDALGYTLEEIEQEIAATDPQDKERLEQLEREYASLEDLKSQEMARARNEALVEVEEQHVAVVEEAVQDVAQEVEPVYSADEMNTMAAMNEAQKHEYKAKLAAEALQNRKVEPVPEPVIDDTEAIAEVTVEPEVVNFDAPIEKEPLDEVQLSASEDPFEGTEIQALDEQAEQERVVQDESVLMSNQEGATALEQIIASASVTSPDKIKQVDKGQRVAYQWNGGSIYGSAEQMPLASPEQFDDLVKDYLQRTENRCPGEFAVVPDSTSGGDASRADSYEVACVGEAVSSGASLLFFNQGGTFNVVAHEAPAEELGTAMNYRNQVMRVVTGSAG